MARWGLLEILFMVVMVAGGAALAEGYKRYKENDFATTYLLKNGCMDVGAPPKGSPVEPWVKKSYICQDAAGQVIIIPFLK